MCNFHVGFSDLVIQDAGNHPCGSLWMSTLVLFPVFLRFCEDQFCLNGIYHLYMYKCVNTHTYNHTYIYIERESHLSIYNVYPDNLDFGEVTETSTRNQTVFRRISWDINKPPSRQLRVALRGCQHVPQIQVGDCYSAQKLLQIWGCCWLLAGHHGSKAIRIMENHEKS